MENVDSFQITENGIIANLKDGSQVTVNDEMEQDQDDEDKEFWNDNETKNRWDPAFNEIMVSLDASYFGDDIDHINGEIQNPTNNTWQYVEIVFALYDENGEFMKNITARITQTINPGEVAVFKTDEGVLAGLGVKRYEIVSITPIEQKF